MKINNLVATSVLFSLSLMGPVLAANSPKNAIMPVSYQCQNCRSNSATIISQNREPNRRDLENAVNQIYQDVLDRDADYRGLRTWVQELENGANLQDIRREIVRSNEATQRIDEIYREMLNRRADSRGIRTWKQVLFDGGNLRDVRQGIAKSREADQAINQIYRQILGRDVDRNGLRTWKQELANGATLSDIRREIENSQEARNRRR